MHGIAHAQIVQSTATAAIQRIAVGTCATCHGPKGHSVSPQFPVLAGQHANYLLAQLQAFKSHTRGDADAVGFMWGMAAPLDADVMAAIAGYYSRQAPRAGARGYPQLNARGKQIYQNGDPAEGVPPCAACHGLLAAGTDNYPRLAGQHVQYLLKQLRSFQTNLRNVAVMHGVAQGLKIDDMRAVSVYLQSLAP
jgi:cytochrome c553